MNPELRLNNLPDEYLEVYRNKKSTLFYGKEEIKRAEADIALCNGLNNELRILLWAKLIFSIKFFQYIKVCLQLQKLLQMQRLIICIFATIL